MKIPEPTDADRERFASFVPVAEDVDVKPRFGNLGAFVRGNMFMGVFGADVGSSSLQRTVKACSHNPARAHSGRRNG